MIQDKTSEVETILDNFNRDGYYLAKGVFKNNIEEMEASFDKIVSQLESGLDPIYTSWRGAELDRIIKQHEKKIPSPKIIHTHNVQRYDSLWMKSFYDSKFLFYAKIFLGEDIILHHSKLFLKPAKFGGAFPMHQDYSYFSTEQDTMIAGIIHVSDGDDQMGGLRVYPGSHKLGRIENSNGQDLNEKLLREFPIENSVALNVEAGDVLFFHYFTLHGSMPNLSDKPRKTVLVQMYNGHDQIENDKSHVDEQIVLNGWNSKMTRSKAGT